ncbi:unnamed protein product [Gordionus sp. m RMFG-2023]
MPMLPMVYRSLFYKNFKIYNCLNSFKLSTTVVTYRDKADLADTPFDVPHNRKRVKIDKSQTQDGENIYYKYKPFENGVNPETGEIGGPLGPEPTRYNDWERRGRVSDF